MKRLLSFLLLTIIPTFCWALDDACTKPSEYTIDKRCYVTSEQKQQTPYNAVVVLVDDGKIRCTGTLVKYDGTIHLFTAKHCVSDLKNKTISSEIPFLLQTGESLSAKVKYVGKFKYDEIKLDSGEVFEDSVNKGSDWAIAKLDTQDVPYVELTDHLKFGFGKYALNRDAIVVGYGNLKILSDKEINEFRNKYIEYLKSEKGVETANEQYGVFRDSIFVYNQNVLDFIWSYDREYMFDIFANPKLKVSFCKYTSSGLLNECQTWPGNSGGGVFDKDGRLMAITIRGRPVIGGEEHMGFEYLEDADPYKTVNLQHSPTKTLKKQAKETLHNIKDMF